MEETKMGVVMPKFKFETEMDLTKTLSAMGMRDAFGLNADFSGIESTKNLFITSVRHRALVGVDEEGTVAAAVTGAAAGAKSKEHSIQINHPFLFLIRDNRSESILFLGRLVDPTSKTGSR